MFDPTLDSRSRILGPHLGIDDENDVTGHNIKRVSQLPLNRLLSTSDNPVYRYPKPFNSGKPEVTQTHIGRTQRLIKIGNLEYKAMDSKLNIRGWLHLDTHARMRTHMHTHDPDLEAGPEAHVQTIKAPSLFLNHVNRNDALSYDSVNEASTGTGTRTNLAATAEELVEVQRQHSGSDTSLLSSDWR